MNCGQHHDTTCRIVLNRVYSYLDGELDGGLCVEIRKHLEECGPCLGEYGLEKAIKQLVASRCGCDRVPDEVRAKVFARIRLIREQLANQESPNSAL